MTAREKPAALSEDQVSHIRALRNVGSSRELLAYVDQIVREKAEDVPMRGTGGNRFIEADATSADLMRSINDQLGDLRDWAAETGQTFDVAEVTITTKRIPSGRISVSVTADLAAQVEGGA